MTCDKASVMMTERATGLVQGRLVRHNLCSANSWGAVMSSSPSSSHLPAGATEEGPPETTTMGTSLGAPGGAGY